VTEVVQILAAMIFAIVLHAVRLLILHERPCRLYLVLHYSNLPTHFSDITAQLFELRALFAELAVCVYNPPAIVRWICDKVPQTLTPSTLSSLGKDEQFLEDIIVGEPSLLGLESRRSGVRGPFYVTRQCALPSPTGKTIYPDIVLLAASGHIVVVEVKLRSNTELMNRSVLAQIIDYAASFVSLTGQQLHDVLFPGHTANTWSESIAAAFPGEADTDDLADQLRKHARSGEINLVIACDMAHLRHPHRGQSADTPNSRRAGRVCRGVRLRSWRWRRHRPSASCRPTTRPAYCGAETPPCMAQ
jgi:hypothetical protein